MSSISHIAMFSGPISYGMGFFGSDRPSYQRQYEVTNYPPMLMAMYIDHDYHEHERVFLLHDRSFQHFDDAAEFWRSCQRMGVQ